MRNAQGSIDTQPDFSVLLGPIDDGVICPEAEPVVRGQSRNVVTQEKEDAQKGDEKSDCLHVVPVHGQLDLQTRREQALCRLPTPAPPRGQGLQQQLGHPVPPAYAHTHGTFPLVIRQTKSVGDKVKISALTELPVKWQDRFSAAR